MGEQNDGDSGYDFDFGDPSLNDTEQQISDRLDDGGNGGSNGATQSVDDSATTPSDTQRQQQDDAAGRGSAQDDAARPGQQRQPGANGVQPQDARPVDAASAQRGLRTDEKGNLVDARGNIVAAAGPHRRLWEKSQRLEHYNSQLERRVAEMEQAAQAMQVLNNMPREMGVSMDDARLGINIVANFRKDPMSVAKWALQETLAMGYNLDQITGTRDAGGGINMQAVQRMLDERLGPVLQERQQSQQQADVQRQTMERYTQFLAKHEYADVHEDVLANMMRGDRTRTPEIAYWQLREWAVARGFDFTQPLGPQVAARQQGVPPQQMQRPNGNGHAQPTHNAPHSPAPMPQGGASRTQMRSEPQMASPDEDWDRIVQSSLREAGMM